MKERDALLDRLGLKEAVLVHYDVSRGNARSRTALNRFLFGRTDTKLTNGDTRSYRYPGLVSQGAEWVGQSVFLVGPDLASRLIAELRFLGIRHWARTVYVAA